MLRGFAARRRAVVVAMIAIWSSVCRVYTFDRCTRGVQIRADIARWAEIVKVAGVKPA